ncbi:Hypothetical predicted protein [Mytilus galloprovincialis]|uniref:Schlafen AlbA-2 domain-containing protein n=1 Tax=Mytilus galloprovincialis TaxID=29158 RepID=A0A8B6CTW8_MYTGA|nr:Hypothetical predicted protein [Mytilus galloprovincialis]
MDNSSSHVYVVTISNLSEHKNEDALRSSIGNLFTKCLRIPITTNDINIIRSQGKKAAIIYLQSLEAAQHAQCVQNNIATRAGRQNLRYNFLQLADVGVNIIVDVKPESNEQHDTCYFQGDKIGSESRNREFKRGGGNYAYEHLKKDVGVYVCAFLNSEEEGTLFIGVNDDGIVEGIKCEHWKEDKIRRDFIDSAIKTIKPDMFPKNYTVKFTPVCDENKRIIEQKLEEEKKIIEQQMKEEQITLKQKMEQEKEILEQKMEQEKTIAEQKIRTMEKREKNFKQHIYDLKKDIQKFKEQHNTTTADKAALEQRITVNEQEKIELARRAEELENEKMRLEHQIEYTKTEVEQSKTMSSGVDEDRKLLEQHVEDMYLKKNLEDIEPHERMRLEKQTNGRQNLQKKTKEKQ